MGQYDRKAQSARKHPLPPSSGSSKAPIRSSTIQRPGWKGPSIVKKAPKQPPRPTPSQQPESTLQEHILPTELQQLLLNIFRTTFPRANDFEGLKPVLQEIKNALFEREFERAFGREEWREAYAVRWSPSRSLGYGNLLAWVFEEVAGDEAWVKRLKERKGEGRGAPAKVVCFGGGAAEVVAFGAALKYLREDAGGVPAEKEVSAEEGLETLSLAEKNAESQSPSMELVLVDTADWASVIAKLHTTLTTAPELSKYASATARANNASLLSPTALNPVFKQADVLSTTANDLRETIGQDAALITLLFTLNELYTASIPKTTKFLLELTSAAPKDSLLLVVDSPGSYSETSVGASGEEKKKYPMQWLMDYVLLDRGKKDDEDDDYDDEEAEEKKQKTRKWEKVIEEESRWFRLDESLKYPVSLENMRFQVHLFRRL